MRNREREKPEIGPEEHKAFGKVLIRMRSNLCEVKLRLSHSYPMTDESIMSCDMAIEKIDQLRNVLDNHYQKDQDGEEYSGVYYGFKPVY